MAKNRESKIKASESQATATEAKIGRNPVVIAAFITAIFGLIGVITTAVFYYQSSRSHDERIIGGTQTAEASLLQGSPATAFPTIAPTPTQTLTAAPSPEAPPIPSPTPISLAHIVNYADGDVVPQFITLMGEYNVDLKDPLWIFVQDPNKLYFPQSMNLEIGQGTPMKDGKWEIRMGVGVAASNDDFGILLTQANEKANQFISASLINGYKSNNFPNFAELPPGVTEIERLNVTRLPVNTPPDAYSQAPEIPDAGLPGQVSVSSFAEEEMVSQEEIITGTVSGIGDSLHLWTFIYTYYGRWYPQSFDPCKGIHTIAEKGQWKTKTIFGDDDDKDIGLPFDVVIAVTDEQANAFLDAKQREWCANKHYPGLLTIELPKGISVKYQDRVIHR